MTTPSPTLRCLSCGYDIASLVETRGRVNPGVCPECGDDLRRTLSARAGLAIQHSWSVRGHARFLYDSIVHPRRTAESMALSVVTTGRTAMVNCAFVGLFYVLIAFLTALAWDIVNGNLSTAPLVALVSPLAWVVVAIAVFMLMLVFSVFLTVACWLMGWRPTLNRVWGALDIGTAWLVLWPLIVPVPLALSTLFPAKGADALTALVFAWVAACPLLGAITAFRAMFYFRGKRDIPPALLDPPASKRPPPSNLESP